MSKYSIYHLVDPENKIVRYVGKSVSPRARLASHIKESQTKQNTAKKQWIKSLFDRGLKPVMIIVNSFDNEPAARVAESREVHRHIKTIYNIHDPRKGARDLKR